MTLPIYESSSHTIPELSKRNKGLYFDRFFDRYTISSGKVSIEDGAKLAFLQQFSGSCGDSSQLTRHAWKQFALVEALTGQGRIYSLNGHFVSGVGNSHPVENGFLWHYTLGVPYLTGSQVKGLVRSLLEQYYEGTDKNKILLTWFGSESKKLGEDQEQAPAATGELPADDRQETGNGNNTGELIFFDALPIAPVTLGVDIMTPHMGKWYLDGGKIENIDTDSDKIPADWHDPNPIPFLAVQEAKFLFTIARRQGSSVDIAEVFACLDQALEYLGVGAKTQVGYGYMAYDENATLRFIQVAHDQEKQEKQERLFQKSLVGKSELNKKFLQDLQTWRQSNSTVKFTATPYAKTWIEELQINPDPEVAELFLQQLEEEYPGLYDDPHKKSGKRQKPVFKPGMIEIAVSLQTIIKATP